MQMNLHHEDINDALREAILVAGGYKTVGALISRLGRQNGCHAVMRFLAYDGSYADPVPIDPESEIARLQREFIEATKALGAMSKRIEVITARSGG